MEGPAKNNSSRNMFESSTLFSSFGTKVYVAFCLDRSGSMGAVRDETIEAFNAYRDTLEKEARTDGTEVLFSMVQFDSTGIDKLYVQHRDQRREPATTMSTFVRALAPRSSMPPTRRSRRPRRRWRVTTARW